MVRFVNPIPFVSDVGRSKQFYAELLGLKIIKDFDSFVLFETGFAIHEGRALERTVWKQAADDESGYGRRNLLLYFEHEDLDGLFEKIAPHVDVIHAVETQAWGQRVFRILDPDGHAIEIGEPQVWPE